MVGGRERRLSRREERTGRSRRQRKGGLKKRLLQQVSVKPFKVNLSMKDENPSGLHLVLGCIVPYDCQHAD